ncbi:multiheme c-type cytochrome [Seleniivibrio woodruffii]|uniref:Multi-heme cytochrome with CxxCH motif n=1 Tax=Seleniivibrio woodruffii TaxID=1078050 RepID=A0A4R1K3F4_9BACT|nr:multiheme c-type cytochrome [Seleniivibrio woodruffii]TCK58407.1 multi-heme cytochrome with CxxCH motif [Seleniivibrio woodruffii]TVZ36780.1 multi-heme cytochrome with CxxCH motif [Seleniivibrio woodruffii]
MSHRSEKSQWISLMVLFVMVSVFLGMSGSFSSAHADARKPSKKIGLTKADKDCIECHGENNPGMVRQWKNSMHSKAEVGCMSCHKAGEKDYDAMDHNGYTVAQTPNAADCAKCHPKQNEEFLKSRHAILGTHGQGLDPNMNWRKPPIYGKTMGCSSCHAGMGNYWPDKTLGDCTQCHNKHDFSLEQVRKPETCKRCHEGMDHGNWESYQNSKHGLVYFDKGSKWNWNYASGEKVVPFDAPVCATCHMSGAPGLKATHNVSERSSWRLASPISFRSKWNDENWQVKRERMEKVCVQCHAESFTKRLFLATDLGVYQFNEVFKVFAKLRGSMNEKGALTSENDDDDPFDIILREVWHDTGRVYRASLMHFGPNKNEAYGYSPMTYQTYELIEMAAEKGIPEAEKWAHENSKDKVWFFPWFDYGGSIWGKSNIALTNNYWYKKPGYWESVRKNVEFIYSKGIISKEQWEMWNEWDKTKDEYVNKTAKDFPPQHDDYVRQIQGAKDQQAEIMGWQLPGSPMFKDLWEMGYKKK